MPEVCGIEYDPDDFPNRFDSPDPANVIEKIVECGGMLANAAEELPIHEKHLYVWASKYDAIQEAAERTRMSTAYKSRDRLYDLMKQDEDKRTAYKSAVKLLTMYDERLDWSKRERREIKKTEEIKKAEKELEDADVDDLLDRYIELTKDE